MSCTYPIEFLPSSFGYGWCGAFRSTEREHYPDGWDVGLCAHIGGVAVYPSAMDAWTNTVLVHLIRENGVCFIFEDEIKDYMRNEGLYWRYYHRRSKNVSFGQRLAWRFRKPLTPLSDTARLSFERLRVRRERLIA
jgi:hypothetical protein